MPDVRTVLETFGPSAVLQLPDVDTGADVHEVTLVGTGEISTRSW